MCTAAEQRRKGALQHPLSVQLLPYTRSTELQRARLSLLQILLLCIHKFSTTLTVQKRAVLARDAAAGLIKG
jgi:hypothetical protein